MINKNLGCNAIMVWRYNDAPDHLKFCEPSDKDWVALVPVGLKDEWISWIESSGFDVMSEPEERKREDGSTIYIGAHA